MRTVRLGILITSPYLNMKEMESGYMTLGFNTLNQSTGIPLTNGTWIPVEALAR